MQEASEIEGAHLISQVGTLPNGVSVFVLDCEDYAQFKTLPKALVYQNKAYGRSGWNSDRYIAYYRSDVTFARLKRCILCECPLG